MIQQRRKNVFVLGLDDLHLMDLQAIPDRDDFVFHQLLEQRELNGEFDIGAVLERAASKLRDFDGPVDAVIGYWVTPDFCAIDPFASTPFDDVTVEFPFSLKPVCGYASILGFRIDERRDFDEAMEITRSKIRRIGEPFNASFTAW